LAQLSCTRAGRCRLPRTQRSYAASEKAPPRAFAQVSRLYWLGVQSIALCPVALRDFTVTYLHRRSGHVKLVAADPTFPDIVPKDGQTLTICGVVTGAIRRFR
jgi:hypothetical protein